MELSDEELIYNIHLGNREAKELLYFRYETKMRRSVQNYWSNLKRKGYTNDDIKGISWECVSKSLIRYNTKTGSFYAYYNMVFKSYLYDKTRKQMIDDIEMQMLSYDCDNDVGTSFCESLADSSVDIESKYAMNELLEDIKKMGNNYYVLVSLLMEGYSYDEISEKLNIPKKKIGNDLYNIRKKIREKEY